MIIISIGRTAIVATHRLSAARNADQIYVLQKGSVIEQGTHETLMTMEGGKYQELVKRQKLERIDNDDPIGSIDIEKIRKEEEQAIGIDIWI